jgi:hypothetical protein
MQKQQSAGPGRRHDQQQAAESAHKYPPGPLPHSPSSLARRRKATNPVDPVFQRFVKYRFHGMREGYHFRYLY